MYQENQWKICFTKFSTSFIVCLSREAWKALLLENGIQVINLNCFPPPQRLVSGLNKLASKQTQFFFPIRGKGHLSYPTTHSWLIIHIASHDLTTVPGIQEMQRRSGEKLGRIFNVVLLVNLIGLKLRHRNLHITHCWLETSKYTKLVRLVGTLGGNGNCSWHWCRQASMIWFASFRGFTTSFVETVWSWKVTW